MGVKPENSGYFGAGQTWTLLHACETATDACPPNQWRVYPPNQWRVYPLGRADRASSAATSHALQLGATDLEYEVTRVKSPVIGRDMNPMGRGDGTYYPNGGNIMGGSLSIGGAKPNFTGNTATGFGNSANNQLNTPGDPPPEDPILPAEPPDFDPVRPPGEGGRIGGGGGGTGQCACVGWTVPDEPCADHPACLAKDTCTKRSDCLWASCFCCLCYESPDASGGGNPQACCTICQRAYDTGEPPPDFGGGEPSGSSGAMYMRPKPPPGEDPWRGLIPYGPPADPDPGFHDVVSPLAHLSPQGLWELFRQSCNIVNLSIWNVPALASYATVLRSIGTFQVSVMQGGIRGRSPKKKPDDGLTLGAAQQTNGDGSDTKTHKISWIYDFLYMCANDLFGITPKSLLETFIDWLKSEWILLVLALVVVAIFMLFTGGAGATFALYGLKVLYMWGLLSFIWSAIFWAGYWHRKYSSR